MYKEKNCMPLPGDFSEENISFNIYACEEKQTKKIT